MVRGMIPTMKKELTELTRNHFAVGSVWRGCEPAPLVYGVLLALGLLVDTANEIDDVAHDVPREAVVDPRRHGGALHAVQDGFEQAPVRDALDEPAIAQVARMRQNVERVRPLAVGLAPMAADARSEEHTSELQ